MLYESKNKVLEPSADVFIIFHKVWRMETDGTKRMTGSDTKRSKAGLAQFGWMATSNLEPLRNTSVTV